MNIPSLRAQLEQEKTWRIDEIRFLQNLGGSLSEDQEKQYRRSLVVMLYAHFEGFCKFAMNLYVTAVNGENIRCGDASYPVAAASLFDLFKALRDPNSKCNEFRDTLPDDSALHRFARDREFVKKSDLFLDRIIQIPDKVIDMESNLTPTILSKNLYKIGLDHDLFKTHKDDINMLLSYRNRVSHGESLKIEEPAYDKLRNTAFRIMEEIAVAVIQSLSNGDYLKSSSA